MKKLLSTLLASIAALQIHAQIITTVAGGGSSLGDGIPATDAQLNLPTGLIFDDFGNMYICGLETYKIRKVNAAGTITTIAGNGTDGFSGDGGPATAAQISDIYCITADHAGNIYFCDYAHNVVRKIDGGGTITTFAGTGMAGFSGNGGPATAAALNLPVGIAADSHNNIFIAEGENNVIRKVDASGIISIFAGNSIAGYTGDGGPAIDAQIVASNLTVDGDDNLLFNSSKTVGSIQVALIRKVNTSGMITTVAGGGAVFAGEGNPATSVDLGQVRSITADHTGNVYIAHGAYQYVRKVNVSGIIRTIAGNGYVGAGGYGDFSGDGGPALSARLNLPVAVATGPDGSAYIADQFNHRVRKVTIDPNGVPAITSGGGSPRIFPNPSSAAFTVTSTENIKTITVTDATGKAVAMLNMDGRNATSATFNEDNTLPAGVYFIQLATASGIYNDRVVVR